MPKLLPGGTKKALAEQFAEEAYRIILKPYPDIENDSGPISERKRFMEFVALTREFLRLMSADEQLLQQIMVYYSALRDLSRGATHPILKPADLAHAPPLNSDVWRSRSTLAIALDYLVLAGISLREASKMVSKTHGIEKLLIKPTAKAESSVRNWRTTLDNKTVGNDAAAERWKASREYLSSIAGMDRTSRQDLLRGEGKRLLSVAAKDVAKIVHRALPKPKH